MCDSLHGRFTAWVRLAFVVPAPYSTNMAWGTHFLTLDSRRVLVDPQRAESKTHLKFRFCALLKQGERCYTMYMYIMSVHCVGCDVLVQQMGHVAVRQVLAPYQHQHACRVNNQRVSDCALPARV